MIQEVVGFEAPKDSFSTQELVKIETISLGLAHQVELGESIIDFKSGTITCFDSFDERNLKFCKHLNIRNSSINRINAAYFNYLLLIDIAYSQITNADFRDCMSLQKIIIDESQKVKVNKDVICIKDNIKSVNALQNIYETIRYYENEKVSMGSAQ